VRLHQLAQVNIAIAREAVDSPLLADFVDALDCTAIPSTYG
jgi:hypothetical protein